ncbi:MAG: phosphoglycerate kinase, partial [Alphaproteobacteria bacterium]|nr:phosphoglycerate kinase [Alphaproteobacteria bacterium]
MDFSKLKPVSGADVAGKRVLVRVDINVPFKDGVISDDTRIRAIVPTVQDVLARGGKPILMAHMGRPKGQRVPALSLSALQAPLEAAIGAPVVFAANDGNKDAKTHAQELAAGQVLLLENLRFHPGEEANTPEFSRELAELGDMYVNDAFSAAHRAHASTEGITHHLPSFAGPSMMAEIDALRRVLDQPEAPTVAVVGGAKVSTKIPVLTNLMPSVDKLIVGGGMANTFLQSMGVMTGQSLAEPEFHYKAREIMAEAKVNNCEIVLPIDAVIAREFAAGAASEVVPIHKVPIDGMILDIGPQSVAKMTGVLENCRTLLWNGPMGAFEIAPFGEGTFALARAAAELTKAGKLVSVAGGGDTAAALHAASVVDDFTYLST